MFSFRGKRDFCRWVVWCFYCHVQAGDISRKDARDTQRPVEVLHAKDNSRDCFPLRFSRRRRGRTQGVVCVWSWFYSGVGFLFLAATRRRNGWRCYKVMAIRVKILRVGCGYACWGSHRFSCLLLSGTVYSIQQCCKKLLST